MKKLLGTGLTSMVGSRFVELFDSQYDFHNLDLSTGVDITHSGKVQKDVEESRAEALIHFAAFTDVNAAFAQTDDKNGTCYKVNVLGTRNVAQSCKVAGKYLINISTDYVFDGFNPPPAGYSESDQPNPIEWYGKTKHLAELEVEKSGVKAVTLRITFPYRAKFKPKMDLVRSIIHKLENKSLYPMFTDHTLTPAFIDDIARAIKVCLDERPTGLYHVVGSSFVSDYELACTIADVFNLNKSQVKKGKLSEYLKTIKRPYQKHLKTSNKKLKDELGVTMSTLEEGLLEMKKQLG